MPTIGVYVDDDEADQLVPAFDREAGAAWPEDFQYHRSAALRVLMRAAVEGLPALRDSGVLPPDDAQLGPHPTAGDAADAVAHELAAALRVGAAVEETAAELGWRRTRTANRIYGIKTIMREADRRDRERDREAGEGE